MLGRLASGNSLDRLQVELRGARPPGQARNGTRAVLIARRDGDSVRWVIVPEDEVATRLNAADTAATAARENAHMAIEALSMLPIATASLPNLLTAMQDLAAEALPAAGQVTFVLDGTVATASGQPSPLHAHGSGLGVMYVGDGPAGAAVSAPLTIGCSAQAPHRPVRRRRSGRWRSPALARSGRDDSPRRNRAR